MDKRKKKNLVEGHASATGFIIKRGAIRVSSKNYSNKFSARVPRKSMIISVLCFIVNIFLSSFLYTLITDSSCNERVSKIFLFLGFAAFVLIWGFVMDKRVKQWHACEHKAANLIEQNIEPILENLKKVSPLATDCGSVVMSAFFFTCLLICALLTFMNVNSDFMLPIFWSAFAGFLYLFRLTWILTRIPLLPYLLQYSALREPTQEQLEETLRVVKEFIEKEKQFKTVH